MAKNRIQLTGTMSLLKTAVNVYVERFQLFFGIIVIPAALFILILFLSSALVISVGGLPGIALLILGLLVFIVVQIWSQAALWLAISKPIEGSGAIEHYKNVQDRVSPLFWTGILVSFITFAGFLLFIVPGIIFAVSLVFSTMLVIVEGVQGTDATRKSREYVKGYWSPVAGRIAVFTFLMMLVLLPLSFMAEGSNTATVAVNLLAMLFVPAYQVYLFEMYKNLKSIKEVPAPEEGIGEPEPEEDNNKSAQDK